VGKFRVEGFEVITIFKREMLFLTVHVQIKQLFQEKLTKKFLKLEKENEGIKQQ